MPQHGFDSRFHTIVFPPIFFQDEFISICGRYVKRSAKQRTAEHFRVDPTTLPDLAPSYNVVPQTFRPLVRLSRAIAEREMVPMRWGLIPFWILLANSSETCRFILPGSFRWVCTRSSPFQKSMQPAVRYELGQLTQAFKFVRGGDYSARSACTGLIVDARFAGKNVANNPNTRSTPGTNTKVHGSF
jgi:SOS response associated peptidase (SRAP)